ncbi:MAG TPA: hypothetical protein VLL48_07250, partial [Longimicrobiales bacterium]|nr:hypothetical protein [Longimicrobiales bacterium]
ADRPRLAELVERRRALGGESGRLRQWRVAAAAVFGDDPGLLQEVAATDPAGLEAALRPVQQNSDRPQALADVAERFLPASATAAALFLRAGRWSAVEGFLPSDPAAHPDIESWIGVFGLGGSPTDLPEALLPAGSSEWSIPAGDAPDAVRSMLAARDDGTGADPLLLAHLAERAGELELAASMFEEESWRYYGPAATYRLAGIRERQGRNEEALRHYRSFLELWSGADPDLKPVVEAGAAVARLGGDVGG